MIGMQMNQYRFKYDNFTAYQLIGPCLYLSANGTFRGNKGEWVLKVGDQVVAILEDYAFKKLFEKVE